MSRRERLERRAELRRKWAESRTAKAATEWEKGDLREEKSGIPFGQPILIGHHSEGRHRRAIERANRASDRALEDLKMAKTHEDKAENIEAQLDRTIFSDDDNAVEALEERIAGREKQREQNNAVNKIIRQKPKNEPTPEKIRALVALGLSEEAAIKLFAKDFCGRIGIPSYVNQNLGGCIKADRDRLAGVKRQQANRETAAASASGVVIKNSAMLGWCFVTFAEKPAREILDALRAAGFQWRGCSWVGGIDKLPAQVSAMAQ